MRDEYNRAFLGIDYGKKRVGIAKSDPTGLIASALTTLEVSSDDDAVKQIVELLNEYEPNGIVIGYPLFASGDKSSICLEVDRFVELLAQETDLPVHKVDESFSSSEAEAVIHAHGKKVGQDKKRIDRLAAVIILQRFLDDNP